MPEDAPAQRALEFALLGARKYKAMRSRGRHCINLLSVLRDDFKKAGLGTLKSRMDLRKLRISATQWAKAKKDCLQELRIASNTFIFNLALADLCVTGFIDPFSIIGVLQGELYFATRPILCEVVASICLTSCFCSLLSIGAISFNRYVHIVHHAKYQHIYTVRNCVLMCIGLWTVSFLLEMPNFFDWGDHVYDRKNYACVWDRTADLSYTVFFSIAGVVIPLIIIGLCYVRIFQYVRASKRRVRQVPNTKMYRKTKREMQDSLRLSRTLFIIFVTFSFCWIPYAIIVSADVYDVFSPETHTYAVMFAHINSSLNSVLYGATNRQFRNAYRRILGFGRFCNSSSPENSLLEPANSRYSNVDLECKTGVTNLGTKSASVSNLGPVSPSPSARYFGSLSPRGINIDNRSPSVKLNATSPRLPTKSHSVSSLGIMSYSNKNFTNNSHNEAKLGSDFQSTNNLTGSDNFVELELRASSVCEA